ncbi:hypothetical protein FK85_15755 [Halorubrum saccharovorum]|uniref:Major pilin protein fimA n=1 Tax=Halorubrum saccharovorum TaxID=2248 RepID=A0A081EWW9_9EURY|nr:DUF1028 domain-containing protein [Halorubrum saccharovorum]KDS91907.1 hypothetical protein FK85_15755 [Halorubrum saccharovorum]
MTFSICASVDGRHGAAIATNAIAVGSTAPFVCRTGAVCTQAMTKTPIGVHAVDWLERGAVVSEAVSALLADDPHASHRQVHGIDASGDTIARTGTDCEPFAGEIEAQRYTVAGNMLTGPAVIDRMADAFEKTQDQSLDSRLLAALLAGEAVGGDKRGPNAQSASIVVFDPETPRIEHDLRVDEHGDAVRELERIHEVAKSAGADWADEYPNLDLQRWPSKESNTN